MRDLHQSRRKVKLTVHRAYRVDGLADFGSGTIEMGDEYYVITVTNASRQRDIVVTHVWLDTTPPIQIVDADLPVRLPHTAPWETAVPVRSIPEGTADVEWRARCQITPDDKVIKSNPDETCRLSEPFPAARSARPIPPGVGAFKGASCPLRCPHGPNRSRSGRA